MPYVINPGFLCERCSHRWILKQPGMRDPKNCPKRKSLYWNSERKHPVCLNVNPLNNDWTVDHESR